METLEFLAAIRDNRPVPVGSLSRFVAGVCDRTVSQAQAAAFLMAVRLRGISPLATAELCAAMASSGVSLSWPYPTADKHSTGGVGDKTSFVVAPLLACVGLHVPMVSGRSLGLTGGTLDKLDSLPGLKTSLPLEELRGSLDATGAFIASATADLAPADAALYALRDQTATIDSVELIACSILSKKLAAGVRSLVLDVKHGAAAFMTDLHDAHTLARTMVDLGTSLGLRVSAALTPMNVPLGRAVGNAAEVVEAMEILAGGGDARLRRLCLLLAAEAASLAGLELTPGDLAGLLDSGDALARFEAICAAQGATLPLEPIAPAHWAIVEGEHTGFFDAAATARAAAALGATRGSPHAVPDPSASIYLFPASGVLARVGGADADRVAAAADLLAAAHRTGEHPDADELGVLPLDPVTAWVRA